MSTALRIRQSATDRGRTEAARGERCHVSIVRMAKERER